MKAAELGASAPGADPLWFDPIGFHQVGPDGQYLMEICASASAYDAVCAASNWLSQARGIVQTLAQAHSENWTVLSSMDVAGMLYAANTMLELVHTAIEGVEGRVPSSDSELQLAGEHHADH